MIPVRLRAFPLIFSYSPSAEVSCKYLHKLLNQYRSISVTDTAASLQRFWEQLASTAKGGREWGGVGFTCVSVQPMDAEIFRLTKSRCVANHQLRQTFEPPGKHQLLPTAAGKLASVAIRGERLAGASPVPDTCSTESARLLCRGDTLAEH